MKTLVVIPTYNERANIAALLPLVLAQSKDIHALVVDDGSPDGTAAEVKRLARGSKGRIHLMDRGSKQGLGSAYVQGFQWGLAKGYRRLVQMDADFSHDPKVLPEMLGALDTVDVAVSTRYLGGRISVVNWPLQRLALSMGASLYVRLVTGLPLSDCTAGYKAWRAEALEAVELSKIGSDGYSFQIEMSYKAWKKGFKFLEIPIIFIDRTEGTSKMSKRIVREAVYRVWAIRFGF